MNDTTTAHNDPVGFHTLEVLAKADHFNTWMYDQFKHELKGEVLEIGSGIGNISKLVIDDGHYITLSDYNEEYCQQLKNIFRGNKNVRGVLQIDLLDPEFEKKFIAAKERFDSIFLLNVIEHIENDGLAIQNCNFLLKKGGHLVVLAPANQWLYCNFDKLLGHYRRYSLKSMQTKITNEQFRIRSGNYFNITGIGGWLLFGKILGRKMLGKGEMTAFNKIVPIAKIIDRIIGRKAGLSIIVTAEKV